MVLLAIQITHFVLTELNERSVTPFSVPKTLTSGHLGEWQSRGRSQTSSRQPRERCRCRGR